MSLFSLQEVYCRACGKKFETDFNFNGGYHGGETCSSKCGAELNWRKTLSILGKPYKSFNPVTKEEA